MGYSGRLFTRLHYFTTPRPSSMSTAGVAYQAGRVGSPPVQIEQLITCTQMCAMWGGELSQVAASIHPQLAYPPYPPYVTYTQFIMH